MYMCSIQVSLLYSKPKRLWLNDLQKLIFHDCHKEEMPNNNLSPGFAANRIDLVCCPTALLWKKKRENPTCQGRFSETPEIKFS